MEGSGVINFKMLEEKRTQFGFFAQQLSYPDPEFFQHDIKETFAATDPVYEHIDAYWHAIQQKSMEEIEEYYVQVFDFQKESTLYMTYYKFEDARERGEMLAKLKDMYSIFGLEMPQAELSDYLPLMCEFLYVAHWGDGQSNATPLGLFFSVLEDGTYYLQKALEQANSPYYPLIKALRSTLRSCLIEEAVVHG